MIFNIISAASTSLSGSMMHVGGSLKNDIEWIRAWFFWSLIGSTVVVLVGVFIEGIEHIVSTERHKAAWHKRVERIGWILVIMGVLGEGVFEGLTTMADDLLQDFTSTLLAITTDQARSAAVSAKTAHAELNVVESEARDITDRLNKASTQLSDIEQDTNALSPRWLLLERGKDAFKNALQPFPGQRLTVVTCGDDDQERSTFSSGLFNLLPSAGWAKPDSKRWPRCNVLSGNEMFFVSSNGTDKQWAIPLPCRGSTASGIEGAAQTLCTVLNRLKISTEVVKERPNAIARARQFWADGAPGSPAEMAMEEPGTIFLLVGPNEPMFKPKAKKRSPKSSK